MEEFHRQLSQLGTPGCHPGCSATCPMLQALQIRIERRFFSPALEEGCFICSSVTWFANLPQTQSWLIRITHRNRPGRWDDKLTQVSSLSTIFWIKIKLLISPNPPQPCHPSSFLSSHPSAFILGKDLVATLRLLLRGTGFWSHGGACGDALTVQETAFEHELTSL